MATTTKYDALTRYVLPEAPGCSDPLAEQALRDAAIEFCERSGVWVHAPDPENIVAGQAAYDIDLPQGAALAQIKSVKIAGQKEPLGQRSVDWLDDNVEDWATATGTPKYYTQLSDDEFLIVPVPDTAITAGLIVKLDVKPSRSSTGWPGWLNERYQEDIVTGAKGRLLEKQSHQWSNPGLAAVYVAQFNTAISAAAGAAAQSFGRGPIRTAPSH